MWCVWRHHELFSKWSTRLRIYKHFRCPMQTHLLCIKGILDSPWLICSWTLSLPFSCSVPRSRGLTVFPGFTCQLALWGVSALGSTCRRLEDRRSRYFPPCPLHPRSGRSFSLIVVIPDRCAPVVLALVGWPCAWVPETHTQLRGRDFLCC